MSSSSPTPQDNNAVIPTVFLIGVTVLMVYLAIPRPYRDPLPVTPTPMPTTVVAAIEPTPEDHLSLMVMGLEEVSASSVQTGSRLFSTTCTACHGSDAKGILGLGKPLIDSPFVNSLNDDELVAFLHVGRPTTDPQNTTGVTMPAKGGNPSLTDDDLNTLVDYVRSLNGARVVNDIVGVPTPIPTLKPFQTIDLSTFGAAATISPSGEASPVSQAATAPVTPTPVTEYGYNTQGQATETPVVVTPVVSELAATPTPVTQYGYETQAQATEEAPVSIPVDATPTTAYTYQTAPDATSAPLSYGYDTQDASQP